MNKLFLGLVLGISISFGAYALATSQRVEVYADNGIEFLRENFEAGNVIVESFKDNKTGVVCYTVISKNSWNTAGISCVKI
jgi:hypothetical protein